MRSEKEQLSLVMERHGIEWEDKGTHDKHLSVLDYKKEQRAKERRTKMLLFPTRRNAAMLIVETPIFKKRNNS